MLYCRKNEFFKKIHLTTLMSCGFRKKKLKKKSYSNVSLWKGKLLK